MKTLGIVAHSFEGAALCFLTACREGGRRLGAHLHPTIVMSAVPMGLSLGAWESGDHEEVGRHLAEGVEQVAAAGADFFLCPDNTAHIVLEGLADALPIPGLHIAEVVAEEILRRGWRRVGLLGTDWTMTGPVYRRVLGERRLDRLVPPPGVRRRLDAAIFDELCQGVFRESTTTQFVSAIGELAAAGADCVVLGCTEIPLVVSDQNSPLPVLDSTRLLALAGVRLALAEGPLERTAGWLPVPHR